MEKMQLREGSYEVLLAQQGDEEAFATLYHRHVGMVWLVYGNYLTNVCRADDWEADALEALLNCLKRYNVYTARAKFSTYLMASLRNRAIDYIRKQNTKQEMFNRSMTHFDAGQDLPVVVTEPTGTPEQQCIARETLVEVLNCRNSEVAKIIGFLIGDGQILLQPHESNHQVTRVQYRLKQAYLRRLYE
ncbi:RNA polymerase sigma factor [Fructobacillus evanidus]|uniref:Sigma24 family (RpoE) n=1 Tax=Fructobacillus evanidus TaxID=3064281 RepID=A0ABN9YRD3_9LACO|nr:DNA-directed RNA polymerase specialized sigma subunit [Fructobacillus sp. LMG 32999]CAK1234917.1 DNA-directed RNA polymerase specialized sigma subunit [Fructobacillus sp. LMG 32999]CAK1235370.1 DNA-directed RNA polymerase specialized sigma subunit [Fructobacillus sp. LMG 32999]CAK1235688.1 DNA-directed RNA polymerase specialized sigma subunit [Fructobacillus sp. LMG 32999]CAK1238378.1 DNA-directed RNA polymerase specialized sigma subunit [Fructobacillus sp. LMG 32999]